MVGPVNPTRDAQIVMDINSQRMTTREIMAKYGFKHNRSLFNLYRKVVGIGYRKAVKKRIEILYKNGVRRYQSSGQVQRLPDRKALGRIAGLYTPSTKWKKNRKLQVLP